MTKESFGLQALFNTICSITLLRIIFKITNNKDVLYETVT